MLLGQSNSQLQTVGSQSFVTKSDSSVTSSTLLRVYSESISTNSGSSLTLEDFSQNKFTHLTNSITSSNSAIGLLDVAITGVNKQLDVVAEMEKLLEERKKNPLSGNYFNEQIQLLAKKFDDIASSAIYDNKSVLDSPIKRNFLANQTTEFANIETNRVTSKSLEESYKETYQPILLYNENEAFGTVDISLDSQTLSATVGHASAEGFGAVASTINSLTSTTKVSASSEVEYRAFASTEIASGQTPSNFTLNGQLIGAVTVQDRDKDDALTNAINAFSTQTGLVASKDNGVFVLKSTDGRGIKIEGDNDKLSAINIIDISKVPAGQTAGVAQFTPGDTLTDYEYNLQNSVNITSFSIDEFDGDFGVFDVFVKNGSDAEVQVANDILSSGDNVSKLQTVDIRTTFGDKVIIRPEGSLGGYWRLDGLEVFGKANTDLFQAGKLEIDKPNSDRIIGDRGLKSFNRRAELGVSFSDISFVTDSDVTNAEAMLKSVRTQLENVSKSLNTQKSGFEAYNSVTVQTLTSSFSLNQKSVSQNDALSFSEILSDAAGFAKAQSVRSSVDIQLLLGEPNGAISPIPEASQSVLFNEAV